MINSRKIEDLTPECQIICKKFLEKLLEKDIHVKIIQTLRDAEYQQSLFKIGRSLPGKKVTNCDGVKKKSAHQSGMAFDIVPVDKSGKILWNDSETFKEIADIGVSLGLRAGYYFKTLPDSPHFEMNK
jgi:peptidoglycan L-alanyl-D-glutamate endopeptidase CwlK